MCHMCTVLTFICCSPCNRINNRRPPQPASLCEFATDFHKNIVAVILFPRPIVVFRAATFCSFFFSMQLTCIWYLKIRNVERRSIWWLFCSVSFVYFRKIPATSKWCWLEWDQLHMWTSSLWPPELQCHRDTDFDLFFSSFSSSKSFLLASVCLFTPLLRLFVSHPLHHYYLVSGATSKVVRLFPPPWRPPPTAGWGNSHNFPPRAAL